MEYLRVSSILIMFVRAASVFWEIVWMAASGGLNKLKTVPLTRFSLSLS